MIYFIFWVILILGIFFLIFYIKNFSFKHKKKKNYPKKTLPKHQTSTKTKPTQNEIKLLNLYKNRDWVNRNLIKTNLITWKQYDSFCNISGIYEFTIIDKNYKKYYIGKSKNLMQRLCYHIYYFQQEPNKNTQYITNAIRYTGIDKLNWKVIISEKELNNKYRNTNKTLNEKLNLEEIYYIKHYKNRYGQNNVYNRDEGGIDYH